MWRACSCKSVDAGENEVSGRSQARGFSPAQRVLTNENPSVIPRALTTLSLMAVTPRVLLQFSGCHTRFAIRFPVPFFLRFVSFIYNLSFLSLFLKVQAGFDDVYETRAVALILVACLLAFLSHLCITVMADWTFLSHPGITVTADWTFLSHPDMTVRADWTFLSHPGITVMADWTFLSHPGITVMVDWTFLSHPDVTVMADWTFLSHPDMTSWLTGRSSVTLI